eukprot:7358933-Prymnesium_polylepis.1
MPSTTVKPSPPPSPPPASQPPSPEPSPERTSAESASAIPEREAREARSSSHSACHTHPRPVCRRKRCIAVTRTRNLNLAGPRARALA